MCRKSLCYKKVAQFFRHIFYAILNDNRFQLLLKIKKRT